MRKMGVGIVGAGAVSGEHIRAFRADPHTEVLALCSRTEEGALRHTSIPIAEPGDAATVAGMIGRRIQSSRGAPDTPAVDQGAQAD